MIKQILVRPMRVAMRVPLRVATWALALACCWSLSGVALAAVEVNTADEAALTSVRGIGPALAKTIVEERGRKGPFKDPTDLADRVKGLGRKSVDKLMDEGLTIGARPAPATVARKEGKADKPAAKAR